VIFVDECFFSRVHCAESGEESMETESVYSLKCHISQDVNHLHEGIKHVSNVVPLPCYVVSQVL
jgi:hypothetical protein